VARKTGVTPGPVWRFTTRGVDHFVWSAISSPQAVSQPFNATVTAKDSFDTTVTNFTSSVRLNGYSGSMGALLFKDDFEDGDFSDWTIGSAVATRAITNDTATPNGMDSRITMLLVTICRMLGSLKMLSV